MVTSGEEARAAFQENLKKLTFNCRPLIMTLTEQANEFRRDYAHIVVGLLEERIRTVS